MRSRRQAWQLLLGLGVTGAFVWLFARDLPYDEFLDALAGLSIEVVLIAVGLLAAGYAARVLRWWVMLRAEDDALRLRACVWPLLTSVAANNVLPFRAGDALRVVGFRRQLQAPASRVLGTLVLERMLDLITLLVVAAVGLLVVPVDVVSSGLLRLAVVLLIVAVAGFVAIVVAGPPLLRAIARWVARRPRVVATGRAGAIEAAAHQIAQPLSLLRDPRRAASLLGLSFVAWGFEGAVFAAVAVGLGLGLEVFMPWVTMAVGTLATLLPSAPGYVGTFDFVVRETVVSQGVGTGRAAAFAVAVHAALWLPLTAAGSLYLATFGRGIWRRHRAITHAEEPTHASS